MTKMLPAAKLSELAAVLADHGATLCAPHVENEADGSGITLTVRIPIQHGGPHLERLSLLHELEYLAARAQLRALCTHFDIDPAALEALLPKEGA